MPDASDLYVTLSGIVLPRLRLDLSPGVDDGVSAVLSALPRIEGAMWRKNVSEETIFA
jgi:hypothetical protein